MVTLFALLLGLVADGSYGPPESNLAPSPAPPTVTVTVNVHSAPSARASSNGLVDPFAFTGPAMAIASGPAPDLLDPFAPERLAHRGYAPIAGPSGANSAPARTRVTDHAVEIRDPFAT